MAVNISASAVKELRETTGAGMMDCKKALVEAEGDMSKAEDIIAKAGLRKAQKTASRTAAQGIILTQVSNDMKTAAIIEVNCETDFVARDQNLKTFCDKLIALVLEQKSDNVEALLNVKMDGAQTVEEARQNLIVKIGENIQFRRARCITVAEGSFGAYTHDGRIGVLIHLNVDKPELAKDIALHVAAMNPLYLQASDVPADVVAKEREIFEARAQEIDKPANIKEKMIEGQINKFRNEICLMGQSFIKDPDKQVGQLLKENNATVDQMIRYAVGEGIEVIKKSFQEEVMEQARGNQ